MSAIGDPTPDEMRKELERCLVKGELRTESGFDDITYEAVRAAVDSPVLSAELADKARSELEAQINGGHDGARAAALRDMIDNWRRTQK